MGVVKKKLLSLSKTLFKRLTLRTKKKKKKERKQNRIKHTTHTSKRKEKPTGTLKIIEIHDM